MALVNAFGALALDATMQAIQAELAGVLSVDYAPDAVTTGSLTAAGQAITVPIAMSTAAILFDTGFTAFVGTVQFEYSPDGGSNWRPLPAMPVTALTAPVTSATTQGSWKAQSPPGATHVRMRCSAWTSGTVAGRVVASFTPGIPVIGSVPAATQTVSGTVTATPAASTARTGFTAASGVWWDDTATALAASGVFTGTSRDLTAAATGATWAAAGTYGEEFRALALTDASGGTLKIQASRDNANWFTVRAVPVAAVDGGQVAEAVVPVYTRYHRVVFANGGTAQTRLAVQSVAVAS